VKVADMLGPSQAAIDLAHRMRFLMGQDLDEFEIARQIEQTNEHLNRSAPQLLQEAWTVLDSTERSCWKNWLTYRETYERQH
jgi:hypothetical protein